MKKIKFTLSIFLSILLTFSNFTLTFANNLSQFKVNNYIYENNYTTEKSFEDYLTNAFIINDSIKNFESNYEVKLNLHPSDFTINSFNFSNDWLEDAKLFTDNYINKNINTIVTYSDSEKYSKERAKSNAIMYSIDRAMLSVSRNPELNLGKEAQYMFISHYIDRNDYYWSSNDERLLLDGPSMSGENGVLADWITSTDRRAYNTYMNFVDTNNSFIYLSDLAIDYKSFLDVPGNIKNGIEALRKANYSIVLLESLELKDNLTSSRDLIKNDIVPLYNQAVKALSSDPNLKLSKMYDSFMEDQGFLSQYSIPDKSSIIKTSLSMIGTFILSGPIGATTYGLSEIASTALKFTIETYTDLFKYAAWASLRYGFSGRYAERIMLYYGF